MARTIITRKIFTLAICLAVVSTVAEAQSGKKGAAETPLVDAPQCGALVFSDGAMSCSCPANGANGPVWGSGPYTADSDICSAARHSGVISAAGGVVRLLKRPGQNSYSGSSQNGVNTSDWGSFEQSFAFAGDKPTQAALADCDVIPDGAEEHRCSCPANPAQRSVWGSGPYTADSDICTAALHSGYLEADAGGEVVVLRVPGLASYQGAENFGVTSANWESYPSSIIFDWNR